MPTERELASLIVALQADIKGLRDGLSSGNSQVRKFAKETDDIGRQFSANMKRQMDAIGRYIVGAFSLGAVLRFAKTSQDAYRAQVENEALLTSALGKHSQALLEQSAALQKLTTFSDDQVLSAQAMLANLIKNEDVVKRLTPLVLDFAAAKRIDAAAAGNVVAKSYISGSRALAMYGIQINGAAGSTARLESMTNGLSRAFKGAAESLAQTPVGKLDQMKNRIDDIQEGIGKNILPASLAWNTALEFTVKLLGKTLDIWGDLWSIAGKRAVGMSSAIAPHALAVEKLVEEGDPEKLKAATFWLEKLQKFYAGQVDQLEKSGKATGKLVEAKRNLLGVETLQMEVSARQAQIAKDAASAAGAGGKPPPDPKAVIANYQATLQLVEQSTALDLAQINAAYQSAAITADQYFQGRVDLINTTYAQERPIIMALIRNADDEADRIKYKSDLIQLETKRTESLTAVEKDRLDTKKHLAEEERKAQELAEKNKAEIESIIETQRLATITDENAKELVAMDAKYAEDLQKLIDSGADKAKQEELVNLQHIERAQTVAEQEKKIADDLAAYEQELYEKRMQATMTYLGTLASTFKGTYDLLYQITGKKSREMFALWKAAALAQAIVSTAVATQTAYTAGWEAGGPYAGEALSVVFAAIAAAAGAVQIATIAATKMAKGGLLQGRSHSSGGIPVEAEGGEYFEPVNAVRYYGKDGLGFLEGFRQRAFPREAFAGLARQFSPRVGGSFLAEGGTVIGTAGRSETSIVNYIDPALFERYVNSAAGRKSIVNVVADNTEVVSSFGTGILRSKS
jgi:hypothetical protein